MTQGTAYTGSGCLHVALEVSAKTWRIAVATERGPQRQKAIVAGDEAELLRCLKVTKRKEGLPQEARVVSCYEAGRDGFWIHRLLTRLGIENVVIDASSVKVSREQRRAKNDRLDAAQLLTDLIRHTRGDRDVWRVVRVPTEEEEDRRRLHRELERLKKERTQHQVRIRSLLALHGVQVNGSLTKSLKELGAMKAWNGKALPVGLQDEVAREVKRLALVKEQIGDLEGRQRAAVREPKTEVLKGVERLSTLSGIGAGSAWLLVMELFSWRKFENRRQVAGATGLGGSPYSSGKTAREQGISKQGNAWVRARMVELAWQWLRHQPQSELTLWFMRRFAHGGGRARRVGIVALARRLLIALWRFVDQGIVPKDALMKASAAA